MMTQLTIQLPESAYHRLEWAAQQSGKSIQTLVVEWISQLSDREESFNVAQDPLFEFEGYESDAPKDLSMNIDQYLYGKEPSQ